MKMLFTSITIKDSYTIIRKTARVLRIVYIVIAGLTALFGLIGTINLIGYIPGQALLFLIGSLAFSFLILLIGLVIEALLIGFSIIVRNNYEELVLKNKVDDDNQTYGKGNPYLEKLQGLNELKNMDLISEEEYNEKKKDILTKL